ncbi:DNA-processing protein DprA [Actinoplanes sp. HUAS TT8]|uniref:DNA-processing protein DprA n=1 Tax=Actinoplanes sp. HUAS TT8 TaxID=3447453 RepID=UPI003F52577D
MDLRSAYLILAWLFEPGDPELNQLVAVHGADQTVIQLSGRAINRAMLRRELHDRPPHRLWEQAHLAVADPGDVITPVDPDWPGSLGPDAPLCLWSRGPAPMPDAGTAITGSRACTSYGSHVATDIARTLAEHGRTIVADGGCGIAAAAIRGALTTGQPPVVLLPAALNRSHPSANRDLFAVVANTGRLLSAYPPGSTCTRHRQAYNRRLLAELTAATVLVEAVPGSTVLDTVRHALDLGRPGLIVPGPITSIHSRGCHDLLRADRRATPIATATDILTDLQR